jgi:hypothetical protein
MKTSISKIACMGLIALGTFYAHNASAQFEIDQLSFGAGLGYTSHAQDIGGSVSFNLRGNYELDEKSSVVVGYNTQLPCSKDFEATATAKDPTTTTPTTVPVTLTQKIMFNNISLDYHRYFVEDIEESFGLYGLVGAGLSFAKRDLSVSEYDENLYNFNTGEIPMTENFTGFMINLGLGSNININDMLGVFIEAKIAIPAGNEYNSRGYESITNPIPFNYCIQAGARYNLFD